MQFLRKFASKNFVAFSLSSSLIISFVPFCDRLSLFLSSSYCTIVMPSQNQHQKCTKNCLCPCCDSFENYEELLEARLSSIDKYICPKCKRSFALKRALEAHQRQHVHAYCVSCNIISSTKGLYALHMRLHVDGSERGTLRTLPFRCYDCRRDFVNQWALIDHLRYSRAHEETQNEETQPVYGNRCMKCKRKFKSQRALEQHLNSIRHNPLINI